MFDWLSSLIGNIFGDVGQSLSSSIWDAMLQWIYTKIFNAAADFFTLMGNMGSEIFELSWVQATIELFSLFGWALFATGTVVAAFDVAIEYQSGRTTIKTTVLNVLKGFFACSLIGVLPVELYQFCVTLQNRFAGDLTALFAGEQQTSLADVSRNVLTAIFDPTNALTEVGLFLILTMIAFIYCIVKIFFANIKRGGILLIQIAVGSLYMFSVPRGYSDGFHQWMRQVVAICLTAFLQTTLLFLGLLTFQDHMLLGLGIMLSANEVPRIAQQFGLDSSVRFNVSSVIHTTSTAIHLARSFAR